MSTGMTRRTRRNTRRDWYSTSQAGYSSALLCNWYSQGHILTPRDDGFHSLWLDTCHRLQNGGNTTSRFHFSEKMHGFSSCSVLPTFCPGTSAAAPVCLSVMQTWRLLYHLSWVPLSDMITAVWIYLHCIWTMCSLCRWEKRSIQCLAFFRWKDFIYFAHKKQHIWWMYSFVIIKTFFHCKLVLKKSTNILSH